MILAQCELQLMKSFISDVLLAPHPRCVSESVKDRMLFRLPQEQQIPQP